MLASVKMNSGSNNRSLFIKCEENSYSLLEIKSEPDLLAFEDRIKEESDDFKDSHSSLDICHIEIKKETESSALQPISQVKV
ncbi:hypothetical protein C0J52_13817 [Blattella germanica]|nr:hypothetical protein C0J52_13817 [Blattella germanica]PSN35746.1 hypothetical protein C0J52_13817 [Blattella germanica]